MLKEIWQLLDEADVVVGQNSKQFDVKTLNARFLFHGLPPPSPFQQVDTKLEYKKIVRIPSYKLDDMGDYFEQGRKLEHEGKELWFKCLAKDKKAWNRMLLYNKQDVLLTEKIYLKLLPWIKLHPNVGQYDGKVCCTNCGGVDVQSRGTYFTNSGEFRRFQCKCGKWLRGDKVSSIKNFVSI